MDTQERNKEKRVGYIIGKGTEVWEQEGEERTDREGHLYVCVNPCDTLDPLISLVRQEDRKSVV